MTMSWCSEIALWNEIPDESLIQPLFDWKGLMNLSEVTHVANRSKSESLVDVVDLCRGEGGVFHVKRVFCA